MARDELLQWLAWRPGDTDEAHDARWLDYQERHLPALLPLLPARLREFATPGVGDELLHDASVTAIEEDPPGRWNLTALCWNSRGGGERRLTIVFHDATLLGRTRSDLRPLVTDPGCGLDYAEFDEAEQPGRYELRISTWDSIRGSFGFRFRDLAFVIDEIPEGTCLAEAERRVRRARAGRARRRAR